MTISVLSAAKRLGSQSSWSLSNLEMQKILYLAHMFHLGRTNGTPLIQGSFEAWDYGPVHRDLYNEARVFGSSKVQNIFHSIPDLEDGPERAIIDEAFQALGKAGPGRLVNATHRKDGAWAKNYIPGSKGCIIPNSDILEEYKGLANAAK